VDAVEGFRLTLAEIDAARRDDAKAGFSNRSDDGAGEIAARGVGLMMERVRSTAIGNSENGLKAGAL